MSEELEIRFKGSEANIERCLDELDQYIKIWDIDVDWEIVQK